MEEHGDEDEITECHYCGYNIIYCDCIDFYEEE